MSSGLQAKFSNNYHGMLSVRFPSASVRGPAWAQGQEGSGWGLRKTMKEGPVLLVPLLGSDCDWAELKTAVSCGVQL